MIPEHCSAVSMQEVDFELTRGTIRERMLGQKVYHKTRYLILRNGDSLAIVEVDGTGYGMFKKVEEIEVMALPEETAFIKAPKADPFNHNSLSRAAEDTEKRVAVVETEFDHITFIVKEEPIIINLVDVVPPHPSKLLTLAERAIDTMTLTRPVRIVAKIVDITKMVEAEEIVYPCRATDMGEHSHAKFLHECPVIGEDGVLVGCDVSRKIFYSEYKRRPKFVNICPKEYTKDIDGFKLIKCCLVEGKVEMEEDMVIVPWGVKLEEIREAVTMIIERADR